MEALCGKSGYKSQIPAPSRLHSPRRSFYNHRFAHCKARPIGEASLSYIERRFMTDQPKKPSWETLAQELGAEATSPPTRPRVEPPKPAVPPASVGVPAPLPATPEAPKKRGWDDLASWLGLGGAKRTRPETPTSPPPPVAPLVAPPPASTPETKAVEPPRYESRSEPRRDRRDDRRERRPERREPPRDEPASSVTPPTVDDLEDDLSLDRPEGRHASGSQENEGGDLPRRRRRRRRRGRGRNREEGAGETRRFQEPPGTDDELGGVEFVRDVDDQEGDEREPASAEADDRLPEADRNGAEREGEDEPRRRRRRRRRGRGGRNRDRDRAPADSQPRMDGEPPLEDDDVLDVDEESITRERIRAEGIADDLEEGHEDEGGEETHLMHRGIPTWEEAIGMIVNVNLEARAKHPHSPSSGHHHRGGRGRGRGGRDRR